MLFPIMKNQEDWKEKLCVHLEQMIKVIKHGPRSYGQGINNELQKMLEMEKSLLNSRDDLCLEDFDNVEKESLKKKLYDDGASKDSASKVSLQLLDIWCQKQVSNIFR